APTLVPDLPGTYVVELIVSDGRIQSAPDSVTLTVSAALVAVPNLIGLDEVAVGSALADAGLVSGVVSDGFSTTLPVGAVSEQNPPAGTLVEPGTPVDFALVVNRPPVLDPVDNVTIGADACFALQLTAVDQDTDPVTFEKVEGPDALVVSPDGFVQWLAGPADVGSVEVAVRAVDDEGGFAETRFTVTVVPGVDTVPALRLFVPEQVAVDGSFAIRARAFDDVGVQTLKVEVDGLELVTVDADRVDVNFNATRASGESHSVRVTATDSGGNTIAAIRDVQVTGAPDQTAPTVDVFSAPGQGAPGEFVQVFASASDNFGVVAVDYTLDGALVGTAAEPPFALDIALPVTGTGFTLEAIARDAAGNSGVAARAGVLVAEADTELPTGVTLTAPASLPAGTSVSLSATAVDSAGIARVELYRGSVLEAESLAPPYTFDVVLPNALVAAGSVPLLARAYDHAGNSADSLVRCATVESSRGAAVAGVIIGPGEKRHAARGDQSVWEHHIK
ncbi:MAG: Ig-like domain-containing protein, partial [Myxococcota bacterium]